MGEEKDKATGKEKENWSQRLIPIGLLSDSRIALPTRVLLVYASFGNPKDGGWCPLSTRSVASLAGIVPGGGYRSVEKKDANVLLSRVRQARQSLIKDGLLEGRLVDDRGVDDHQYRAIPAEPPASTMVELDRLGRSAGIAYEARAREVDWSAIE